MVPKNIKRITKTMKKQSYRTMRGLCYAALFLCGFWLVFFAIQTYYVFTTGSGPGVINWDSPRIGLKLGITIANRVVNLVMLSLCVAFVVSTLKSIKQGVIFSRSNVPLLSAMAAVIPFYAMICDNTMQAFSTTAEMNFQLTDNVFVYTLVVLIVAQLYKVACDAAEEQQLTI